MSSRALLALTASALALPGIVNKVHADAAPTSSEAGYRYSSYQEDDLPRTALQLGSRERYDIDVHQFRLMVPLGERYSLTLNSSYESMSGASPWYALRKPDGSTGIVMSGATISEQRRDLQASGRRYLDNGTVGVGLSVSHENDYDALSVSLDGERHFNNDATTVSSGVSYSSDDLDPTDARLFNRVTDESRRSASVFAAVSQILNQTSLIQTGLSITHLSGFLSDPYKLFDSRPDSRTQTAWTTAWRQFITPLNAALHADYRYFHDTFGIDSHTVELAWYQNVGDTLQIVPGLRYYSQSAADFFVRQADFSGTRPYQSTDYRLSGYGAWSGSLKVQLEVNDLRLSATVERYRADAGYALNDDPVSPALVAFTRLSFGVDYQF